MTRIEFTADPYELSVLSRALTLYAEHGLVDYSCSVREPITIEGRVVARSLQERIGQAALRALETERVAEEMRPWRN